MPGDAHVISNPLSGEQIVIRRTAAQSGGAVLDWGTELAPGGGCRAVTPIRSRKSASPCSRGR